jgi:alpha-ketoglutaric semialdehyde dehydrogenase
MEPVLIDGKWRDSDSVAPFQAMDPNRGLPQEQTFPVSSQADIDAALEAGIRAAHELRKLPRSAIADFLDAYADAVDADSQRIVETAHSETGLPISPRLEAELPRTTNQLRQAASAVREGSWTNATIDTASNIRSMYAPLDKPVIVFGPNNFPMAFNGVSGGDFAAAIAAGNPVIAKANPGHPRTTQLLAGAALKAIRSTDVPEAMVQLIYRVRGEVGLAFVSDSRVGAVGFTGSKSGGLKLKAAADAAGVPIYLELSSVNPIFLLDGALEVRGDEIAQDFYASCTMGAGQYCTNPGFVVVPTSEAGDRFVKTAGELFGGTAGGTLLGEPGHLGEGVSILKSHGAEVLVGGGIVGGGRFAFENTLLTVTAAEFLDDIEGLQTEVFGPVSLLVRADTPEEMAAVASSMEGNLTGGIFSESSDEIAYDIVEAALRPRVGRLLNDKMPTGVAVVSSMNHGGPYPATGHPGFTAVGIPASIHRFSALYCYDNVAEHRLPEALRNTNPSGEMWRFVDGTWTKEDIV